jgi:hypothetical protein
MTKYDPWGPISSTLFSTRDSDFVQQTIDLTGVGVQWPRLDEKADHSHLTRIRAFRPAIQAAYSELADEQKGQFAGIVAKQLGGLMNQQIVASLNDIGWTITQGGILTTQDAILSEQFFPPGTPFDAYVAIRSILQEASRHILIVDAYMGGTLFVILRSVSNPTLSVALLTTTKAVQPDFRLEAAAFQQQFPGTQIEVRTTAEFHDRFIVVDNSVYYHVGASIKDAGKRAFVISRLEDQPIIQLLEAYIQAAWQRGTRVI